MINTAYHGNMGKCLNFAIGGKKVGYKTVEY